MRTKLYSQQLLCSGLLLKIPKLITLAGSVILYSLLPGLKSYWMLKFSQSALAVVSFGVKSGSAAPYPFSPYYALSKSKLVALGGVGYLND